jgi:NMT1-like family
MSAPWKAAPKVFDLVAFQYGITVIPAEENASFERAAAELIAGNLDAACFLTTVTAPAIQQMAQSGVVAMVPIERAEAIAFAHPYLEMLAIPRASIAGTVECPSERILTIASREILVCSYSISEDIVFDVLAAIYDGLPDLAHDFPLATQISRIDPQQGFYYRLHPGASKYYQNERFTWHGFLETLSFLVVIFGPLFALKEVIVRVRHADILKPLKAIETAIEEQKEKSIPIPPMDYADMVSSIHRVHERAVDYFCKGKISKDSFEQIRVFTQALLPRLNAAAQDAARPTAPTRGAEAASATLSVAAPSVTGHLSL